MGLFHCSQDISSGIWQLPMMDMLITIVLLTCYILHRKNYHKVARIVGLTFLNFCFAAYACIVPAELGIYLFYFPLIAISMGIFGPDEKRMRLFFVLLSASLLIGLFISDFNLIGSYEIETPDVESFFFVNLISSTFILVVSITFILGVNEESEKRLHLLADEIKIKNSNLEKTNAELDRFFYSTSHDLRSPLLSIKGLVNIARNETGDPKMQQYLEMMNSRVDRLDFFIKDIIDYSKNARTEIVCEDVDISSVVEGVRENLQFLEGAERIQFESEILVNRALTDKTRLNIILNNLSSNAIKYHDYTRPNPWVRVSMNVVGNNLNIGVSDNGLGICAERQTKIFDMFYRGTEQSKGSGLGLFIVKETIDKMKGTIRVDSIEGEGTSFNVKLPLSANNIVRLPVPT